MRDERTPMVDTERNCCFGDFEATGTASLRRNTLAEATMVPIEIVWYVCTTGNILPQWCVGGRFRSEGNKYSKKSLSRVLTLSI